MSYNEGALVTQKPVEIVQITSVEPAPLPSASKQITLLISLETPTTTSYPALFPSISPTTGWDSNEPVGKVPVSYLHIRSPS